MIDINTYLKNLYLPSKSSHKGQNGRLLIIGGSHLFHSASLWALEVASRIVDLVHYSSVEENNRIVQKLKIEFRDGIVVPRFHIEDYINEDDCILIGPGMVRNDNLTMKQLNLPAQAGNETMGLRKIEEIRDEGMQTYFLTKYLLQKYPEKRWVIDAGALQMVDLKDIPEGAILTPHRKEFEKLLSKMIHSHPEFISGSNGIPKQVRNDIKATKSLKTPQGCAKYSPGVEETVKRFAKQYHCVVLLKGEKDIVVSKDRIEVIKGGNAGMTKGGTGDVLAGLVAALYCKNGAFTSSVSASFINKKAGEELYKKMGYWFNASDLSDQIPETMKKLIL